MKLLLIMPNFFNYPKIIIEELEKMGYEVDFFNDRPSTKAFVKAAIRVNKNIMYFYIKKYFDNIMNTITNKKYDVVFLISGQSLSFSGKMILRIKTCQPKALFVLYQWDSQKNFPYIISVQKFFDKCYSFDRRDTKENNKLKFLPLFYSRVYEDIGKRKREFFRYDFCFIGTAHPKKYESINTMSKQLKYVYPNYYIYYFFPSSIVFLYRKVVNKELRKAHYNEFHYVPIREKDMLNIYESSRFILDSAQAGQTGLTIRILEALGAKKKIITTNEDVRSYDFYIPENIYIYNRCFDFNDVFFTSTYRDIDEDIYAKYSLRNWLKEILY